MAAIRCGDERIALSKSKDVKPTDASRAFRVPQIRRLRQICVLRSVSRAASAGRLRHDRAYGSRRGVAPVILRRSEFAAHEHMRAAELHAARGRLQRGEMDFARL